MPNFADAHGNRANILVDAGFPDEALKSFDRALALNPNSGHGLAQPRRPAAGSRPPRGGAGELRQGDRVRPGFRRRPFQSRQRAQGPRPPGRRARHARLRRASTRRRRPTSKAIALDPRIERGLSRARPAQSAARRLGGRLCRLRTSRKGRRADLCRRCREPRWDGELRAGERLVLVSEQGLGDTIQFCRFAPLLAARGFDVTILTRKAMAPLLSTLTGVTIATDADALAQDQRPLRWLPLVERSRRARHPAGQRAGRGALSLGHAGAHRSLARTARRRRLQDRHQLGGRATRTRRTSPGATFRSPISRRSPRCLACN